MRRRLVMMRPLMLLAVGLFATAAERAAAQDFSAHLVDLDASGQPGAYGNGGELHVSGDRVRFDREQASGSRFLVDVDRGISYVIAPQQRLYMDAKQSSPVTQIFVPVDPEAPCVRWQQMAVVAGAAKEGQAWRCERVGEESLSGRATIKYAMTSPKGAIGFGWIDPALKFLVKFAAADGSVMELRNIAEESQPEALFTVPAEFRKYDFSQLIERVKRSDGWVEPVK